MGLVQAFTSCLNFELSNYHSKKKHELSKHVLETSVYSLHFIMLVTKDIQCNIHWMLDFKYLTDKTWLSLQHPPLQNQYVKNNCEGTSIHCRFYLWWTVQCCKQFQFSDRLIMDCAKKKKKSTNRLCQWHYHTL
jgi:hypothetical protein